MRYLFFTLSVFLVSCIESYPDLGPLTLLMGAGSEACSYSEPAALGSVQPLYPASGNNWNDYVEADGSSRINAQDNLCSATGVGYGSCIHGGEMRLVQVTNRTSCEGLEMNDNLGAFNWICDDSTGQVRLISGGLKEDRYLSDLIDISAATFRPNQVNVSDCGGESSTASTTWWSNGFIVDPAPGNLNAPSNIHLFRTNMQGLYTITSDGIIVVVDPAILLEGDVAAGGDVFSANNYRHLWIEGSFLIPNDDFAIDFTGVHFSRIENVNVDAGGNNGPGALRLNTSSSNMVRDLQFSGAGNAAVRLTNSSRGNLIYRLKRFNGWQSAIQSDTGEDNILLDYLATNIVYNLVSQSNSYGNIYLAGTMVFAQGNGMYGGTGRFTLANAVTAANGDHGFFWQYAVRSEMQNAVSSHSQADGFRLDQSNSYNFITGIIGTFNNVGTDCTGGANKGILNGCLVNLLSDFTYDPAMDLSGSFVGPLNVDDTSNSSVTNGAGLSTGAMSDNLNFENRFRVWGNDGGVFPNAATNMGRCPMNCRLWDFSLRSTDNVLRNRLSIPTGNDYYMHRWSAGNQAACEAIVGAQWQPDICDYPGATDAATCAAAGGGSGIWQTNLCGSRILKNAYERINDGHGNENGLCESGEHCVYTPNLGAYQGHGDLIEIGPITDGSITGVTLWQYELNGR